jgi:hypothetical protein
MIVGAGAVAAGVYLIVEWGEDKRLTFAVQIYLGLAVGALGLFVAAT